MQAQGAKLTEAERDSRARAIDEKKKQLDRDTQDAQSDFQGDMQQMISDVAGKVGALMTDYAEKHGYTLVLDAGDQQNATVLYAVPVHRHHQGHHRSLQRQVGHPGAASAGAGPGPDVDAPQPQPAPAH